MTRRYKRKQNIYFATPLKKKYQTILQMHLTPEEQIVWSKLKSRQLGVTFVTQKIILGYIVDFYCQKYQLAIEIDGSQHDPTKDWKRTQLLNQVGVYVLRFTNAEVRSEIDNVIKKIETKLKESIKLQEEKKKLKVRK